MQALDDERALRSRSVRNVAEMCVSVAYPTIFRTQRVLSVCRCICGSSLSKQSVILIENAVVGKCLLSVEIVNETPVSQVIPCQRCREYFQYSYESKVAADRGYDPVFQSQWETWLEKTPHEFYPTRVIVRRWLGEPNLPKLYGEGMAPHMLYYKPAIYFNVVKTGQSSDPLWKRDCVQTSSKGQGWVTGLSPLKRHVPDDWDDPDEPPEVKHLSDVDIVQAQVVEEACKRTNGSYSVWTASKSVYHDLSYCSEDAVGRCRVSKGKQMPDSPEGATIYIPIPIPEGTADEILKDH